MTDLVDTRLALHAVAERVLSPLRVQATGNEIALCVRAGGFGTPDLPQGGWAGFLDGDVVRVAADGSLTREPLRSLRQAARVVGLADPDALADDPLIVSDAAAQVLARTWADGEAALHGLLATLSAEDAGSDINLWPEHFDIAIDAGDATTGARATYGVSPGDAHASHPVRLRRPVATAAERPVVAGRRLRRRRTAGSRSEDDSDLLATVPKRAGPTLGPSVQPMS